MYCAVVLIYYSHVLNKVSSYTVFEESCCDATHPDKLVKTVQYADDCIAFLNDKNELCTVLNLISEYGKASGLTLN